MEHIREEIDLVKETVKQESEKVGFVNLITIFIIYIYLSIILSICLVSIYQSIYLLSIYMYLP